MNDEKLLLSVEDHFQIEGRGLVVTPLLNLLPNGKKFEPFSDSVVIRRPDGTEDKLRAQFGLEHFSFRGGGGQWNIVVVFPSETKASVPLGTDVFVSSGVFARIRGEVPTK